MKIGSAARGAEPRSYGDMGWCQHVEYRLTARSVMQTSVTGHDGQRVDLKRCDDRALCPKGTVTRTGRLRRLARVFVGAGGQQGQTRETGNTRAVEGRGTGAVITSATGRTERLARLIRACSCTPFM